jgi:glycosyltransferase involved in cell wall biosynthesis
MPLLSIGVPVFNGENYLRQAVESILSQDFGDFELVISDNASTDGTSAICADYARMDKRVRLHRNETNIGAIANHNLVFQLSTGKYFKWAAHDDECAPGVLAACVRTLEDAPDQVALVYPQAELIGEKGEVEGRFTVSIQCRDRRPAERFGRVVRYVRLGTPLYGVIRPEMLRRTRLLGAFHSSDLVLLAELALIGEIWELPMFGIRKRMHRLRASQAHSSQTAWQTWADPSQTAGREWRIPGMDRVDREYVRRVYLSDIGCLEKCRCLLAVALNSYGSRRLKRWSRRLRMRVGQKSAHADR